MSRPENPASTMTTIAVTKAFRDHVRIAAALCGMTHAEFCALMLDEHVRNVTRRLLAAGALPHNDVEVRRAVKRRRMATKP